MKSFIAIAVAAALVAVVGSADAAKGPKPGKPGKPGVTVGLPDLSGESISFKTKCNGTTCTLNNLTFVVRNSGDGDMPNSSVSFYLSSDAVLTTETSELNPIADNLIRIQSLGKVKAGKTKKRTLGGGLLKKLGAIQGQYIIAVVDSNQSVLEFDELNNVFVSEPLP